MYISDNGRIRKLTASTGIITTIAGGGSDYDDGSATFGGDNGAATSAVLSEPYGVALDSSGRQHHMINIVMLTILYRERIHRRLWQSSHPQGDGGNWYYHDDSRYW